MKINSKTDVAGYSHIQIRDCLNRFMVRDGLSVDSFANELKTTRSKASKIFDWLVTFEYIKKDKNRDDEWEITSLGSRFTNATAAKPFLEQRQNVKSPTSLFESSR